MDAIVGAAFYRFLGLLTCALFSTAAFAGGGYLVRVGPKPLRFAEAAPRRDPGKVLPPLAMSDLTSTNSLTTTEEFGPQPRVGPVSIDEELLTSQPEEATPGEPAPAPRQQATPEAMLHFFNSGKRRDNTLISVPIEFTPPAPSATKSSTATYTSE